MRRWLENNPVGVMLVSAAGALVIVSMVLAYTWSLPASSPVELQAQVGEFGPGPAQEAGAMGPLSDYRVVTERPLFDESRKPVVSVDEESMGEEAMAEVADAPQVVLLGVVMTPDQRLVTLRPVASSESLIAAEGEPLEGEYTGWSVTEIRPRSVVLASRHGENLELDLQVNTRKLAEPAKPARAAKDAGDAEDGAGAEATDGDNEQPMSRAEEIRQRIAERREELRQQSEQERGSRTERSGGSAYYNAIRNMVNRKKDDDQQEEENEDDGDG